MKSVHSLILLAALLVGATAHAQSHRVRSPDGRTEVIVRSGERLTYSVRQDGRELVSPSRISLTLEDGRVLGHAARVERASRSRVSDTIHPVVAEKNAVIPDRYNELRLDFRGDYGLVVRAYDDGVAYRFVTDLPDSVTIVSEEATFRFPENHPVVFGADSLLFSHQEPLYARVPLDSLAGRMGLVPLVVEVGGGPRLAITEAALEDYPGMHIVGREGLTLAGLFPRAALEEDASDIENVRVSREAPYLARTVGRRAYPWRAIGIAPTDAALVENQLVFKLAPELRLEDASWIRPGKVAWDWWNALNLHGVDFDAGINTRTYQYYIDFAAEYGVPYVILDLGWTELDDLTKINPNIDMPAVVAHAREKGVGLILWALWKPLDRQMDAVLDQWQRWGVKGIKVDYMQRDDQQMVNFYWRVAREAAERQMLVDLHGAYKPAGLRRAYPNVITREGVRGLEWSKWSRDATPEHDVTLPFTRMFAGPMDYTPGAMINASREEFRPIFTRPMSQGTRAHQLAMYVVYESPLSMLSDNPVHYQREPEVTRFIAEVPTTWDETRALDGRIGDYITVARRKGDDWYVGAMTDWEARTLPVDLSFLEPGEYSVEIYRDGPNADRYGEDHQREVRTIRGGERLEARLAPGGGWVARIRRAPAR